MEMVKKTILPGVVSFSSVAHWGLNDGGLKKDRPRCALLFRHRVDSVMPLVISWWVLFLFYGIRRDVMFSVYFGFVGFDSVASGFTMYAIWQIFVE
jgi:hypothetical protein